MIANTQPVGRAWAPLLAAVACWLLPAAGWAAPGDNCSGAYYVNETLPSGARWQLCWEERSREGIVLRDVYYTPPGGSFRKILYEAAVAQIHVPYDENGARFHDVTDYGLGGDYMNDLTSGDCPGGTLLRDGSKDVLCKTIESRGDAHRHHDAHVEGHLLELFSVSHVGEYNYIPQWRFFDDGTIDISMGATGELQRLGSNPLYGWPVRSDGTTAISHIHNYYWRLDFDLGEDFGDELVDEIEFVPVGGNTTRELAVQTFNVETARSVNPDRHRSWRIRDAGIDNSDGHPVSYHLEPGGHGHRHIGPSYEPFTFDDFYVTAYDSCEDFASHNPTSGGCGEDVTDFVDGESVFGADVVVWYGITFHHTPRDEDEPKMPVHWDGFQIVPRDWTAQGVVQPACSDGVDNDGDTYVDLAADPGCGDADDLSEQSASLACDDGLDNDGDGFVDFADPQCSLQNLRKEAGGCGLGFELAPLLGVLGWLGRRRRRATPE